MRLKIYTLFALLLLPLAAAQGREQPTRSETLERVAQGGECRDPPLGTICDEASAARYLLHIAGELDAARDWCLALGSDGVAWQVALDLWARRNREYLDAAARIASGGDTGAFTFDGPLLDNHEPAIPVSEAQCRRDLRHVDEGRFDVDLVPELRPLKRFLDGN